jgi:hypothetical protein
MNRHLYFSLAALLSASFFMARSVPRPRAQTPAAKPALNLPGDTIFLAKLTTNLDLQQCIPGEPVEAEVTHDVKPGKDTLLKKGSILLGHVVLVEVATPKQPDNKVGVVFDGVKTKDGQQQSAHLLIRALAPQMEAPANSTIAGGRGMPGETDHVIASGHDQAETGGIEPLKTSSLGVFAIPGLTLGVRKTSSGQQIVILSWSKGEIRLKKGAQLLMLVVGQ